MAKLADIHVYHRTGGAEFSHKFPCYVSSDGEFSCICKPYDAELRAFAAKVDGVSADTDRDRRWRLCSRDKRKLESLLRDFGKAMLSGDTDTRIFIYFAGGASGTIARSDNGHVSPFVFGENEPFNISTHSFAGRRDRIAVQPDVALVEVKKTETKTGIAAYSTNLIRETEAERRDDVGESGVTLAKWSNCHIGSDDWKRINSNLLPYTEADAARVNHLIERLAELGCDMAQLRDEERGDLFAK